MALKGQGMKTTFDLFVGFVPLDWHEKDVREKFSKYGEIQSILLKDSEKEDNMQYGFVRFINEMDSEEALKHLHGLNTGSTRLRVSKGNKSRAKPDTSPPQFKPNKNPISPSWQKDITKVPHTNGFSSEASSFSNGSGDKKFNTRNSFKETRPPQAAQVINGPATVSPIRIEPVLVTEVVNAVQFWAQTLTPPETEKITQLSTDLQVYCNQQTPSNISPLPGKLYATQYTLDNMWYRCQTLESLPNNQFNVQFIDYGNTEVKSTSDFVEMSPELSKVSPGAKLYILSGLEPWSSDETQRNLGLEQLKSFTDNKILEARVCSDTSPCSVILKDEDVDIGEAMEKSGFAKRKKQVQIQQTPSSVPKPLRQNSEPSPSRIDPMEMNKLKAENNYLNKQVEVLRARVASQAASAVNSQEMQKLKTLNEEMKKQMEVQKEKITILSEKSMIYQQRAEKLDDKVKNAMKHTVEGLYKNIQEMNKVRFNQAGGETTTSAFLETAIELVQDDHSRVELAKVPVLEEVLQAEKDLESAQVAIQSASDKESLPELITSRNNARQELHKQITLLIESLNSLPLDARRTKLKEILDVLNNIGDPNEVEDLVSPLTLEEAVKLYKHCVDHQASTVNSLQSTTNQCSLAIVTALDRIKNTLQFPYSNTESLESACDLDILIEDHANAVKSEVQQAKSSDGVEVRKIANHLVHSLSGSIKKELEEIDYLLNVANVKYTNTQNNLGMWLNSEPDVKELITLKKTLKTLKSKFRHTQADRRDLEENTEDSDESQDLNKVEEELSSLREELHAAFIQEHAVLTKLANISKEHFPELPLNYPDLKIAEYLKTNGLVKVGRELEHYSHHMLSSLPVTGEHICLKTKFNGNPCILKEYGCAQSVKERAVEFSAIHHKSVIRLDALFEDKPNRKAYIQVPYYEHGNISDWREGKSTCQIKSVLKDVLAALQTLHSAGLTHGAVYAENVLVHEEDGGFTGILADFDFSKDVDCRAATTKQRLNFTSCDSSCIFDVQCYGQLVYQVLVPSSAESTDRTGSYIAEDPHLMSLLSGLLHQNPEQRLTAGQALEYPFFHSQTQ